MIGSLIGFVFYWSFERAGDRLFDAWLFECALERLVDGFADCVLDLFVDWDLMASVIAYVIVYAIDSCII